LDALEGDWVADDKPVHAEEALPASGRRGTRPGVESDLAAIVEGIAAGKRAALKLLYDRYGARLYGIAQRILRDNSLAEDALQEAFVKIWRNAAKFDRARGSALGWVVIIVRRAAFDLRPREAVAEPAEIAAIASEQPETDMLDPGLARALAALPEAQREALLLSYVHGLTHAELAAAMGAPLGTVKSWVRRGAAALKDRLGDG
jgi:RNA polymerase sigma-70 factor (ECF subfamily)